VRDIPLHLRISERANAELFRLIDQVPISDPVAAISLESGETEQAESWRVTFYDRGTVEGLIPGAVRNICGVPFVFGGKDTDRLDGGILDFREGRFVVDSLRN